MKKKEMYVTSVSIFYLTSTTTYWDVYIYINTNIYVCVCVREEYTTHFHRKTNGLTI